MVKWHMTIVNKEINVWEDIFNRMGHGWGENLPSRTPGRFSPPFQWRGQFPAPHQSIPKIYQLSSFNISIKIIYLKIWSVTIWWNFWHIRRFQFFVVNIFPINAWKTEDHKVCQVWSSFSLHLWTICDFLCHQHHFLDFQFSLSCQWPIVFLSNPWRHSPGSWANQFYLEWIIWMKIKERRTKNYYHDEDNSFFLPPRIFS